MHATSLRPDVPDRQLTLNEHFLYFRVSYNIILYYYIILSVLRDILWKWLLEKKCKGVNLR